MRRSGARSETRLRPSAKIGGEGRNKIMAKCEDRVTLSTGANEQTPDQETDEPGHSTEVEVHDRWSKDEMQEQEKTEKEHVGLDKAAMEADNISRHSDEARFTLVDGMPRPLEVGAVCGMQE